MPIGLASRSVTSSDLCDLCVSVVRRAFGLGAHACYRLRMTIEVGQPAPAFTLRNKKREEITGESFPGKHLVLAFYPLAFTGG